MFEMLHIPWHATPCRTAGRVQNHLLNRIERINVINLCCDISRDLGTVAKINLRIQTDKYLDRHRRHTIYRVSLALMELVKLNCQRVKC